MPVKDIKDRAPNKEAIASLERLLKEVKSGEVRSVFYVLGYEDDSVSHGWALDARSQNRRMLAEMVMAQHDYVVNIEMSECSSVLYNNLEGK